MKFAVAALIGVVSATTGAYDYDGPTLGYMYNKRTLPDVPTWTLRSVNANAANALEQKAYGEFSTKSSNKNMPDWTKVQLNDSSSDSEDVQLEGDDSESDHSKEFYNAWDAVKDEEEGYHRALPAYFSGDSDDLFMRSMCKTYALEGKNKDGSPNGNFMMDEATTRAAASEVLETHKGLKGDEKKKYLDTYFARTFAHFDVTKSGKVEVIKMPQFMRFLASDQYMSLQG